MPTGSIKFFNPDKGFGFISPDDSSGDIYLHVSAVERAGFRDLNSGDRVSFQLARDRRTGKASAIELEILDPRIVRRHTAPTFALARRGPSLHQHSGHRGGISHGKGSVKWFDAAKGFGFIIPFDGGGDVFVHITAVEQIGLHSLVQGQVVSYDLKNETRSGRASAVNLRLD